MYRHAFVCAFVFVVLSIALGGFALAETKGAIARLDVPVLNGSVLPDGMTIELSFNNVPGAHEYVLERDIAPDFPDPICDFVANPATSRIYFIDRWIEKEMMTLYYRVKATPPVSGVMVEESSFSNVVALTPIDLTPEPGTELIINPTALDFQTFEFYKQLVVRNASDKEVKVSLWPNAPHVIALSDYGLRLNPFETRIVEVELDRAGLDSGLFRDWEICFLTNSEFVGPAANQDGQIEIEAEVAGPIDVAPIAPDFLLDATPNGNGLIDSGEEVNCQLKLTNTDANVHALDLTVRIVPKANVTALTSGGATHVNNLGPLRSVYVPFSFEAAPVTFDCEAVNGPVVNAEFLVLIADTFGYSWEETVKVGICAPFTFELCGFEIDDDNQGISGTVPHTHNKMIECGEIIEARVSFLSNYDLYNVSLSLSDDQNFVYLPDGDAFSYKGVGNLRFVPMCGEVTPDRDFEFRAWEYDTSPIVFTLSGTADLVPGVAYSSTVSHPVNFDYVFSVNGHSGPEVTITTTNLGPRASVHDGFAIETHLRNLSPVDKIVDLYVGAVKDGEIYYFIANSSTISMTPAPFSFGLYLPRNFSGARRMFAYECPDVANITAGEYFFISVLQAPEQSIYRRELWYSFDWVTVNVNY